MSPNNKAPDLHSVRELIYEIAQKHWLTYIDMEKKSLYKMPWELQTQIQSVRIKDKFTVYKNYFFYFYLLENTESYWWFN